MGAIARILRQRKLTRTQRRKHQKKRDLREVKARYRALEHVQVDVKYLTDLGHYWPQMERLGLPRYQYTLRDTKSGLLHLGFADGVSVVYAQLFVERWLRQVEGAGVELTKVVVQTDRGGEFSGNRKHQGRGFVHLVENVLVRSTVSSRPASRTRMRMSRPATGSSSVNSMIWRASRAKRTS